LKYREYPMEVVEQADWAFCLNDCIGLSERGGGD
jgi:hypothetical protein